MYRSSYFKDVKMQEIISKEMLNGFNKVFGFHTKRPDIIQMMFDEFCYYQDITFSNQLEADLLLNKIMGLYAEIADTEYRYTFDEHGEWLLYQILLKANETVEEGFSMWEDMEEKEDRDSVYEDFWESSLSDEEKAYVEKQADACVKREMAEIFYEMAIVDPEEEARLISQYRTNLINRICYFPKMLEEVTEDVIPKFLFWDHDFALIDGYGVEVFDKFAEMNRGSDMDLGFMHVSDRTQMMTGSMQFDLIEEDDGEESGNAAEESEISDEDAPLTEKEKMELLDKKIEQVQEVVSVKYREYQKVLDELKMLLDARHPERIIEEKKQKLYDAYLESGRDLDEIIDLIQSADEYI